MNLRINGIRYYAERHQNDSKKRNLLLLHGFMGSSQSFKASLPLLAKFINPVTIDLLGHGKTEGADSSERFAASRQIEDLKQLIDEIFESPPFLHGYSMGGRLALRYALTHPKTVRRLIIESTNSGAEDHGLIRERRQIDEERARAIEADYFSFVEEWQILPIFKSGQPVLNKMTNFYQSIQKKQDPKQMAGSLRGFGTASMKSVKSELSKLELPVLILAGKSDPKYTEIAHEMNRLFCQSTFKIIPNAGHRVHRDQPEAFSLAIQNFIDTNLSVR